MVSLRDRSIEERIYEFETTDSIRFSWYDIRYGTGLWNFCQYSWCRCDGICG